ncbi:unnamed protein product [Trichobilharzia regenti]|nr:unnamed protein product [Trichobilharzia regenti]
MNGLQKFVLKLRIKRVQNFLEHKEKEYQNMNYAIYF